MKNKFDKIDEICEARFNGIPGTSVTSKVIAGGYQIKIYRPTGTSYINCYNTGTVTYQGADLPDDLQETLRKVTVGNFLATEDTTAGLVSVLSLSEILSMWEAMRDKLLDSVPPYLVKQINEIPKVPFE